MRGVNPVNNNSQQSFGMKWTKSTPGFLKKAAPRLIEDGGYETAKEAITNLNNLGKRKDGIQAKLHSHGLIGDFLDSDFDFILSVKDKRTKHFFDEAYSTGILNHKNPAAILKSFSETISETKFIDDSKDMLSKMVEFEKSLSFREKANLKIAFIGYALIDYKETAKDILRGTYSWKEFVPYRLFSFITQTPAERKQTKDLRKFIDESF